MTQKVAKEIPLSSLTLRKYEKPRTEGGRELVKRLCLSIGLLEPGDSRDIIVDILKVFIKKSKSQEALSIQKLIEEVILERKNHGLSEKGCSEPNVRRQILRLKNIGLIEKINGEYRLKEFLPVKELIESILNKKLEEITSRIILYSKRIDEAYKEESTDESSSDNSKV